MVTTEDTLQSLLQELKRRGYRFVTPNPATHAIVISRPLHSRADLRDIFGWNRPFEPHELDPDLSELAALAGIVGRQDGRRVMRVRVASLEDQLFFHSAFPTSDPASVFFGPDTYRFSRYVLHHLAEAPSPNWIAEMGAGSGAVGIVSALLTNAPRLSLIDINGEALRLAKTNAATARIEAELILGDRLPKGPDLIIANPPYLVDPAQRTYRHGGSLLGTEIAIDWVRQVIDGGGPKRRMLLYTGAPIVAGRNPLIETISELCASVRARLSWEEIDPDVFGEELRGQAYGEVERIAAIGALIDIS